jgi:hypothetical protein
MIESLNLLLVLALFTGMTFGYAWARITKEGITQ